MRCSTTYIHFLLQKNSKLRTAAALFSKLEVNMLFVQTAEVLFRDRVALIAQELLQLCTNKNWDRNYNTLFAHGSERP